VATELEFTVLEQDQIQLELEKLPDWEQDGVAIRKAYVHGSFLEAIAFVNRVAVVAEKLNHHPDIDISFKRVIIRIWTHKKNATTMADMTLAHEIGSIS
jgi:4a-hydroxytetrahydrobiopterin dehydratase